MVILQRLSANKISPEQIEQIIPVPIEEPKAVPAEPSKPIEEIEKEKVPPKTDKKGENKTTEIEKNISTKEAKAGDKPVEKTVIKNDQKDIDSVDDEESLTPPLLPSMKIVSKEFSIIMESNNKNEKDKNKKSEWDMFADQDIFKTNTNVSIKE